MLLLGKKAILCCRLTHISFPSLLHTSPVSAPSEAPCPPQASVTAESHLLTPKNLQARQALTLRMTVYRRDPACGMWV